MELVVNNKNVYVVSDIHNDADRFKKLLKQIRFSKEDILIVNGDIFDRGEQPVELMEERLTSVDLLNLADWIDSKPYFIELILDGKYYQIAHAQTFPTPNRVRDMQWFYMGDFHHECFIRGEEEFLKGASVVGHTPTNNYKIWKSNSGRTIRIDCGNGFQYCGCNGTLGAIRLNDMDEYYVD